MKTHKTENITLMALLLQPRARANNGKHRVERRGHQLPDLRLLLDVLLVVDRLSVRLVRRRQEDGDEQNQAETDNRADNDGHEVSLVHAAARAERRVRVLDLGRGGLLRAVRLEQVLLLADQPLAQDALARARHRLAAVRGGRGGRREPLEGRGGVVQGALVRRALDQELRQGLAVQRPPQLDVRRQDGRTAARGHEELVRQVVVHDVAKERGARDVRRRADDLGGDVHKADEGGRGRQSGVQEVDARHGAQRLRHKPLKRLLLHHRQLAGRDAEPRGEHKAHGLRGVLARVAERHVLGRVVVVEAARAPVAQARVERARRLVVAPLLAVLVVQAVVLREHRRLLRQAHPDVLLRLHAHAVAAHRLRRGRGGELPRAVAVHQARAHVLVAGVGDGGAGVAPRQVRHGSNLLVLAGSARQVHADGGLRATRVGAVEGGPGRGAAVVVAAGADVARDHVAQEHGVVHGQDLRPQHLRLRRADLVVVVLLLPPADVDGRVVEVGRDVRLLVVAAHERNVLHRLARKLLDAGHDRLLHLLRVVRVLRRAVQHGAVVPRELEVHAQQRRPGLAQAVLVVGRALAAVAKAVAHVARGSKVAVRPAVTVAGARLQVGVGQKVPLRKAREHVLVQGLRARRHGRRSHHDSCEALHLTRGSLLPMKYRYCS
eukprot:Rhum_TRINITY_DN15180_c3_g1::Rhum_TRINITY_DN15180_c3_g1_i2::g.138435::m.138435